MMSQRAKTGRSTESDYDNQNGTPVIKRSKAVEDTKAKSSPADVEARKRHAHPNDEAAFERMILKSDLVPIAFLARGLRASRAVCRLTVRKRNGVSLASGFLVSPNLLITNNHVIRNEFEGNAATALFNYELDVDYNHCNSQELRLNSKAFFFTDKELDFTLIGVEGDTKDFGYIQLRRDVDNLLKCEYVTIIQHPLGREKEIALRENSVTELLDNFVNYVAGTDQGSSGSPVFNDQWQLVALHHKVVLKDETKVPPPLMLRNPDFVANQGVRISSVVKRLEKAYHEGLIKASHAPILQDLFNLIPASDVPTDGEEQIESLVLPDPYASSADGVTEAKRGPSLDYTGSGYNPNFLGVQLQPPEVRDQADLSRLKDGSTVLKYHHFSIVMSKSRRIAHYTAVNIDGRQLKDFKRKDSWCYDPRLPKELQIGEELYRDNPIDRGHLVRRIDPGWGEDGRIAESETFHYTNCSPQHEDLNQRIWLRLEDFVISQVEGGKTKACVFTGPIFCDNDPYYRKVRIPLQFWKVFAIIVDGNLSVSAFILSQKDFMKDMLRINESDEEDETNVGQVALTLLETQSGLTFDPVFHEHDTLGGSSAEDFAPAGVGKAIIPIRHAKDIVLKRN